MKAIKKSGGEIWLVPMGDPSVAMEEGDTLMNECDAADLPPRYFRDLYQDDGGGDIEVDLADARSFKLDKIRVVRDRMLKKSDEIWTEESSKAEDLTDIQADKVDLRDLPADADTALTALDTLAEIRDYDAFDGLSLNKDFSEVDMAE